MQPLIGHPVRLGLISCIPLFLAGCATMPEIHRAVLSGDPDRIRPAVQQKESVNTIHRGRTPLHIAVERGDTAAARLLLTAGAKPDAPLRPDTGQAAAGTALILTRLLLEGGAKVDAPGWNGMTPLMEAARMGRPALARYLIDRGAVVNRTDEDGRTALIWAALTGRAETARILVGKGADTELKDIRGRGPTQYARSRNHRGVLIALRAASNTTERYKIRKSRR